MTRINNRGIAVRSRVSFMAICLCSSSLGAAVASAKATFSAEDTPATLSVTYTLTGSGVERPASNERNVTWTVNDRYESKVSMTARKPSETPGLHAVAADGKPAMASTDPNMQAMADFSKKATAKCGKDQACIQQEYMSVASELASRADNNAAAGPRYQEFQGGQQTGTYHVDEKAHEAYYDAACSSRNETPCAFDTAVAGEGPGLNADGKASYKTSNIGELDLVGGTFSLLLPPPGMGKVKRIVTSASKDVKTGSFDETRWLRAGLFGDQVRVSCGECRTASGTTTLQVEDELLKRKAKLVIEWKFVRN